MTLRNNSDHSPPIHQLSPTPHHDTSMFRNPRENSSPHIVAPLKPSIGRPPTPPNGLRPEPKATMSTRTSSNKPLTPRANSKTALPTIGKQGTKKVAGVKTPARGTHSILNFFKKVDSPNTDDGGLFVAQGTLAPATKLQGSAMLATYSTDRCTNGNIYDNMHEDGDVDHDRYNEDVSSLKKRKLSNGDSNSILAESSESPTNTEDDETVGQDGCTPPPSIETRKATKKIKKVGAFVDDSDSEDDSKTENVRRNPELQKAAVKAEEIELRKTVASQSDGVNNLVETYPMPQKSIVENKPVVPEVMAVHPLSEIDSTELTNRQEASGSPSASRPSFIKREETTCSDFAGFEDIEDFPDEEFEEGEEFVERKWMEEQARLEDAEYGLDGNDALDSVMLDSDGSPEDMAAACPMCNESLTGISVDEASRHVNACLDGNSMPLPKPVKPEPSNGSKIFLGGSGRFSKAAIARPGQANPFDFGSKEPTSTSAFSKIMTSKAEDMAWANAAAAEHASRGKAAYQRTCPFYKIMPGFFICVDAFRYGAVQGCNAYFLSHFHSDHYIGLTSKWCHGPIYCSKVTGNLVKQQLKVDAKWVVSLDFEEKIEVPGTQGVSVTMIPANHCPGSSLYLLEKVLGKGSSPKIQRVLHCGDFRACTAHISHPQLMPNIVDTISGKTKQQKIDVCYLDTTYLNPRYAFPSQEDVIKACSDMCVSLKKERAEESDGWEIVKKERAGAGMSKFISNATLKPEDDSIAMTTTPSEKPRGRLLVICGTYSIGKERICMGIARALDCKIWCAPGKRKICAALEDEELMSRLTDDPLEAQIHMQMLMEIRAETLQDYLNGYKPHFSRIVGFRPSGWNYRPPNSRFIESPSVATVLGSDNWRSRYSMADLVPQRGSTREASCFGVPYSEHSSFRELTLFCCALRIEKVVPTVNVGTSAGRAKMKVWIERWLAERRKNGPVNIGTGDGMIKW